MRVYRFEIRILFVVILQTPRPSSPQSVFVALSHERPNGFHVVLFVDAIARLRFSCIENRDLERGVSSAQGHDIRQMQHALAVTGHVLCSQHQFPVTITPPRFTGVRFSETASVEVCSLLVKKKSRSRLIK